VWGVDIARRPPAVYLLLIVHALLDLHCLLSGSAGRDVLHHFGGKILLPGRVRDILLLGVGRRGKHRQDIWYGLANCGCVGGIGVPLALGLLAVVDRHRVQFHVAVVAG
jgi:hypothetical protein